MKSLVVILLGMLAFGAAHASKATERDQQYLSMRRRIEKTGWYAGIGGSCGFQTWNYRLDDGQSHASAVGPGVGGTLYAGRHFYENFRAELEIGWIGSYSDQPFQDLAGYEFSQSATTAAVNGIASSSVREWGRLYAGAGAGIALVSTEFNTSPRVGASSSGPMGQFMAGYEKRLTDLLTITVGARVMAYYVKESDYRLFADNSVLNMGLGTVVNVSANVGFRLDF